MRPTGTKPARAPQVGLGMALVAMAGATLWVTACSAVLDGDRHRGADASSPPEDGQSPQTDGTVPNDGAAPDPCQSPPTAVCGQPVDETCPPTVPDELAMLFPGKVPLGLLRPTTVMEGASAYAPDIASASVPVLGGGHGTTVLLARARRSGDDYGPVRVDVPLNDLLAAAPGALPDGDLDLSDTASVTSIAAQPLNSTGSSRVVFQLGNSADGERWSGYTDLVSVEDMLWRNTIAVLDDVGTLGSGVVTRWMDGANPTLEAMTVAQGGLAISETATDVPGGDRLRMAASAGSRFVMLQDQAGSFWFWEALTWDPVSHWNTPNQSGKAAWVHADSEAHVLAWQANGQVTFTEVSCPFESAACAPTPIVVPSATVSTIAPSGEVPDGVPLPDGRVAVIITERYGEGDRLVLQVLDATLNSVSTPRIPLLDLRDAGERVTDARLGWVETATATTLVVTAAVGDTPDGASRVVMTGLRACPD